MKKIIAIFFLLFFCLGQTGHFLIYCIQRWHIKNEVRDEIIAGVPDRYLDVIEYSNDIKWEEEGKEFSLKDEFYDVVRIKACNGKTFLYCLNDKNEERLVKDYARIIKSTTDNETGKSSKQFFKFHLMDYFILYLSPAIPSEHHILKNYFNYEAALASNNKEVMIPPPWASPA